MTQQAVPTTGTSAGGRRQEVICGTSRNFAGGPRDPQARLAPLLVMGDQAAQTPDSLLGLLTVSDLEELEEFYWRLENHVVVQGSLSEAAPAVVWVLFSGLVGEIGFSNRWQALELVFQIVGGESHPDAEDRGQADPWDRAREACRTGRWFLHGLLDGPWTVRHGRSSAASSRIGGGRRISSRCGTGSRWSWPSSDPCWVMR
jgi:hypothetical protein